MFVTQNDILLFTCLNSATMLCLLHRSFAVNNSGWSVESGTQVKCVVKTTGYQQSVLVFIDLWLCRGQ